MNKSCKTISQTIDIRNIDASLYPSRNTQLHKTTPDYDKIGMFGIDSRQQMKYK
jgi:hypothetical protein